MEMETPLPRHLHRLRHQGSSFIYLILGLVLLMPLIWQEYGSDEVRKWHPFFRCRIFFLLVFDNFGNEDKTDPIFNGGNIS